MTRYGSSQQRFEISNPTMALQREQANTKIRNDIETRYRTMRRHVSVSAISLTTLIAYPGRATGLAFKHPIAAALSVLCDVGESVVGGWPDTKTHEFMGLMFHLIVCMLTASP